MIKFIKRNQIFVILGLYNGIFLAAWNLNAQQYSALLVYTSIGIAFGYYSYKKKENLW